QVTSGTVVGTDTFSGSLVRAAGENVGTRAISQGSLSLGTNYTLTFIGANLTITVRPITVSATTDSKVYDATVFSSATPTITAGSLAFGQSATFSQVFDSANVGSRTLTASGSVSDGNGGANYAITFLTASGSITARAVTVTADAQTKVYGENDPNLSYQVTSGTVV